MSSPIVVTAAQAIATDQDLDPVIRATRNVFTRGAPALPVRPREQTSGHAVERISEKLHAKLNPLSEASAKAATRRQVQHYYAPSILHNSDEEQPIDWMLGDTVLNGGRLFVQGAARGVGASTLVADYARSFNVAAGRERDPRRIVYLSLTAKCKSVGRFLDALSLAVQAPLSVSELRHRGEEYLATRLRVACQRQGICLIAIDHLSLADACVRTMLAGLMRELDPNYSVALEPDDPLAFSSAIAVVLVDDRPPEVLFRDEPEVLLMLEGQHAVIRPYSSIEQVGEAMRQAGIGLGDFDLNDADDRAMAAAVLEQTSGLPAIMTPMFSRIDQIALRHRCRPSPEIVQAVSPYVRRMVELRTAIGPDGSIRKQTIAARGKHGVKEAATDAGVTAGDKRVGNVNSRESILRARHDQKELARLEQRDILKKSHVTLRNG